METPRSNGVGIDRIGQIAINVKDVARAPKTQAAHQTLNSRGVTFVEPPRKIAALATADLWMGFFRDPDGNPLALQSEVARG